MTFRGATACTGGDRVKRDRFGRRSGMAADVLARKQLWIARFATKDPAAPVSQRRTLTTLA